MNGHLLDDCLFKDLPDIATEHNVSVPGISQQESSYFTVYNTEGLLKSIDAQPLTALPCRVNYKISLLDGYSRAEYADKVIDIEPKALLFSTPKIPYHWLPQDLNQPGASCVFTADFLLPAKSGVVLDELPIFKAGGYPVFQLSTDEANRVQAIFQKMQDELASDYVYKYDLLRNYALELIHFGQKLQPAPALQPLHGASARVSSLFTELLERQFPIKTPKQQLHLRTAKDYADQLAVHVNHLNKVLKETTGRTTTELITNRVVQEAKVLLRQPKWTLAEIADSLGFTDVAHFSKSFKQQTALTPGAYRNQVFI
ncbi:helix-turn-helix domain-containing protein [Spirosoma validum]|uniref:Helix-turn-helix transcriptional regulator n=1 Tax=Spirosoma validum TaxID=2771355 RepID=A0A927B7P3_9BACT|nr:helix-turn-helix transcriptional regulator [Spirosoma validum]MBD2756672.1 helix-turn-helix transcriptional regulator [Spirosoma validum]